MTDNDNDFKPVFKFAELAISDAGRTAVNDDYSQHNDEVESGKQNAPSTKDMILGLGLFSFSIALYSVYCMLIKIVLGSYVLSVPELTYYISLILVVMFYFFARQ